MASPTSEDHYDEAAASVPEIPLAEAGAPHFAPAAQAESQAPAPRSPTAYEALQDMALCMVTKAVVSAMAVIQHNLAQSTQALGRDTSH